MAICDLCRKPMLDGFKYSVPSSSGPLNVTVCRSCGKALDSIKDGNEDAYRSLSKTVASSSNVNAQRFFDAHVELSELPFVIEAKKREEEKKRVEKERRAQEYLEKVAVLKHAGADGYYEYKVIKIQDNPLAGCLNADEMMDTLNQMGVEGWRLVNAYSNELGKNALALGGFGVNATADEHILIFERFQKIK